MKRRFPGLAFLLAFPLLMVACETPETEPASDAAMEPAAASQAVDVAAVEQAIRDREDQWEQAAMASVDSFATFYTSDGVIMPPNAPPVRGAAAIVEAMGPMFSILDSISFDPLDITVSEAGDMVVEQGRYTLSGTTPDGAFDDEGSYLVVWTNQDGQWMVTHDIFNTDRPMEGGGM